MLTIRKRQRGSSSKRGLLAVSASRVIIQMPTGEEGLGYALPVTNLAEIYLVPYAAGRPFHYGRAIRQGVFVTSLYNLPHLLEPPRADSLRAAYVHYPTPGSANYLPILPGSGTVSVRVGRFWKKRAFAGNAGVAQYRAGVGTGRAVQSVKKICLPIISRFDPKTSSFTLHSFYEKK